MNVRLHPPRLTPEEFEELSDTRGLELLDGRVVEKHMGTEAGSINALIGYYLGQVVVPGRLGAIVGSEGMYCCFPRRPGRVRKPDVSFIRRDRLPDGRVPAGICRFAPDLAVEVVSPNDEYEAVDDKVADYYDAGVPLVWVVAPRTRTVLVYHPDGTARRLTDADDLTADQVVPGFRVRVADLFPNPPAPPPADAPDPSPA